MTLPPSTPVNPHPRHHILHAGYTVLVTRPGGGFEGHGREGLFDFDTRILSRYRLTIDGRQPVYVGSEINGAARTRIRLLAPRSRGRARGPRLPQDALEVTLDRQICHGMLERLVVRNHSMAPAEVELAVEFEADFADVLDLGRRRRQSGSVLPTWDAGTRRLDLKYRAEAGARRVERGLRVRVVEADSTPVRRGRALR